LGEAPNSDVCIPANLEQALAALKSDEELVAALGPELVDAFVALKEAEWHRYVAAVSDPATTEVTEWEIDYYLPFH
jgi:glutamine synthetase